MAPLVPVKNLTPLAPNGLVLSWGSNTTLTIGAGRSLDSSGNYDISVASTLTINAAVNGANGLDSGTFAASTWYYVFVIASSVKPQEYAVASLISASAVPYLPKGYDCYVLRGMVLTDSSIHFLKFYEAGDGHNRERYYDAQIRVINGGTQTSYTLAVCQCYFLHNLQQQRPIMLLILEQQVLHQ
jgi:hypothetical protein